MPSHKEMQIQQYLITNMCDEINAFDKCNMPKKTKKLRL